MFGGACRASKAVTPGLRQARRPYTLSRQERKPGRRLFPGWDRSPSRQRQPRPPPPLLPRERHRARRRCPLRSLHWMQAPRWRGSFAGGCRACRAASPGRQRARPRYQWRPYPVLAPQSPRPRRLQTVLRKQCRQRRRPQLLLSPYPPHSRGEPPRFVAGSPVSPMVNHGRQPDLLLRSPPPPRYGQTRNTSPRPIPRLPACWRPLPRRSHR
ncbi:MAG: hypothetical protein JWM13_905 [Arthrobacter sp.]|nr:hypothetical protein [Arthrobacter sp.]